MWGLEQKEQIYLAEYSFEYVWLEMSITLFLALQKK